MKRKDNKNIEELNSQLKTIIAISKIVNPTMIEYQYSEEELNKDDWGVMSPDNVCMIIGKNKTAKRILNNFVDTEMKTPKIPNLDYNIKENSELLICSRYDIRYLSLILNIYKTYDSSPMLFMKQDFPITFEDDYFKIILAPRVE